jgi:hypothetical protein
MRTKTQADGPVGRNRMERIGHALKPSGWSKEGIEATFCKSPTGQHADMESFEELALDAVERLQCTREIANHGSHPGASVT